MENKLTATQSGEAIKINTQTAYVINIIKVILCFSTYTMNNYITMIMTETIKTTETYSKDN